jgi:predicted outer membrane protein
LKQSSRGARWTTALLAVAAMAGGCDRREPEPAPAAPAAAPEPEPLLPAERLALAAIVHREGAALGEAAAGRLEAADAQQLAAVMASDHRALAALLDSVSAEYGLREATGFERGDTLRARLEEIRGRALVPGPTPFDSLFLRAAAAYHGEALEAYTHAVQGPGSPEVMAVLRDARHAVEAHARRTLQVASGAVLPPPLPPPGMRERDRPPESPPAAEPPPAEPPPVQPPPPPPPPDTGVQRPPPDTSPVRPPVVRPPPDTLGG